MPPVLSRLEMQRLVIGQQTQLDHSISIHAITQDAFLCPDSHSKKRDQTGYVRIWSMDQAVEVMAEEEVEMIASGVGIWYQKLGAVVEKQFLPPLGESLMWIRLVVVANVFGVESFGFTLHASGCLSPERDANRVG